MQEGVGERQNVEDHVLDGLADAVRVDLLEERVARVEELVDVVDLLVVEADLVVDDAREGHEARAVVRALHAEVVAVARQVVELVDVDRVAAVAHNVEQEGLLVVARERPLAGNQRLDHAHVIAVVLERVLVHEVLDHLERHVLVVPAGPVAPGPVLERVRERAVAEVVAQASECHEALVALGDVELGLLHLEPIHEVTSQVANTDTVLESSPPTPVRIQYKRTSQANERASQGTHGTDCASRLERESTWCRLA